MGGLALDQPRRAFGAIAEQVALAISGKAEREASLSGAIRSIAALAVRSFIARGSIVSPLRIPFLGDGLASAGPGRIKGARPGVRIGLPSSSTPPPASRGPAR